MTREYPKHSHQFVVCFYRDTELDRMFGPFMDRSVANCWARQYNKLYAPANQSRLYNRYQVFPVCWALPLAQAPEPG